MKREILFKGKTVSGEWAIGNLSVLKKDIKGIKHGYYISNSTGKPFAYEVHPETVCQFTGLTDKNGVKIFEGDIMQHANPFDEPFIVNFDYETASFVFNNGSSCYGIYDESFSVIGNIHD